MDITWVSEGEIYMIRGDTEAEREFLEACPKDWPWQRVLTEWDDHRSRDEHRTEE